MESTRHDLEAQPALNAAQRQRPFESWARRWGDEVYFETPAVAGEEGARELVSVGDVAYWPPGRALCLFFGPTPISKPGEIRPASPVNVIGRVVEGLGVLRRVASGEKVRVEPLRNARAHTAFP